MQLVHSHSAIKLYEDCPQKYYRLRIAKDIKDSQTELSLHGDRVHKSLEERIKSKKPLSSEVASLEPVVKALEKSPKKKTPEYKIALDNTLKPTTFFSPTVWIRGKIDVLALGDTDATILDWKTGKRKYMTFDQLELNSLMVFSSFPKIESIKAAYVWAGINKSDAKEYFRVDMNKMWGGYIARIRKIYHSYENNNWPAKPSFMCKFCPARETCDYAE